MSALPSREPHLRVTDGVSDGGLAALASAIDTARWVKRQNVFPQHWEAAWILCVSCSTKGFDAETAVVGGSRVAKVKDVEQG